MSLGVKAGINYGGTGTSDAEYAKHFTGVISPYFGLVAEYKLAESFFVQPELTYHATGFNRDETITANHPLLGDFNVDIDVAGRLQYLTLPIMAKYYIMDGLSLEAGPYVGFLLGTKISGTVVKHLPEIGGGDQTEEYGEADQDDFKKGYTSTDIGMGFGATYALESGLFVSARYNMGLTDISVDKDDLSDTQIDGVNDNVDTNKPKGFQFSIGYKFM
jgi:hypothetical protein